MHIEHAARDGCIVVALVGKLDLVAAPKVRRALLKHLADQPDAVICDLAGVARIDPMCASVFAAVAHRPRSRWPDSHLLLCGARPAVAAALTRQGTPRLLPVYASLDQALAQARSRPPFLRERLGLATTLEAFTTAGSFAGEVCQRWQLEELAETARSLAGELVIDAIFAQRSHLGDIELRAGGLLLAVHSGAPDLAGTPADHDGEPGSGRWSIGSPRAGVCAGRQTAAGWCGASWGDRGPDAPERCMRSYGRGLASSGRESVGRLWRPGQLPR
jgi:anti-anti-sigma factor